MCAEQVDMVFSGEIPELYDRYVVPLIFEAYANDLAELVAAATTERVLELAAGTGVVSRTLSRRLPSAAVTATDLNQAMLDYAATQTHAPNIDWRRADAMTLPFARAEFDAVVCQFGVMFFPDRVDAYQEARRVLRPGGRLIFNTWDRIEDNEIPMLISDAVAAMFPSDPPLFLRRTPHGYHDVTAIREDVYAAGFDNIDVNTVAHRSVAPSPRDAAVAFCAGTPLRNEIEARDPTRLEEAVTRSTEAVAARFGAGEVDGKIQAHVVIATKQD